jgi:hypothetical protein
MFNGGAAKECFMNAYRLAEGSDLIYVEGYATSVIPVLHAWVLDPRPNDSGKIIETTWENPGEEYFGVAMPMDYVRKVLLARKFYGVLDCYEIGFPLLTGEHEWPPKNAMGKKGRNICASNIPKKNRHLRVVSENNNPSTQKGAAARCQR